VTQHKQRKPKTTVLHFRVRQELMAAIDREVARLLAERPGSTVTRGDAVRDALYRALVGPRPAGARVVSESPFHADVEVGDEG